jgi:type IV pilus assembly protein PilN
MVRINLLPDKKLSTGRATVVGEAGQLWILAVLGAAVFEIIVCLFVYKYKEDEHTTIVGENGRVQQQIDTIKHDMANHDAIKAQLKELRDREEAIGKLLSARTGPTATLLELSRILTAGRGPTTDKDKLEQLKRDNPGAVLNPNWDSHRVWLTQYIELERNVRIAGLARDPEDVSELQRRLLLSDYFSDVNLMPGAKVMDQVTKQELVRFELNAKVRY